ncbi:MAG TPA: hypothetical protein VFZ76_02770 [Anaerolineales bacterium]
MPQPEQISQGEAIKRVSAQIEGPVALNEFVERVLDLWPSKAKDPKSTVRQSIRDDHLGKDLLFLDETTLLPMRLAMRGVRFRIPLSRQEVERGWLFVYPSFQFMFKRDLEPGAFWFEEPDGHSIPVNPVTVKYKEKTLFGVEEFERPAFDPGWWYKKHNLGRKDGLLATILDWETGRFQLQPEPAREREKHRSEIQDSNQAFADLVFADLESARYEDIRDWVAIPSAYLRLKDSHPYPGDHWLEIIDKDPRMRWTGHDIRYADWESPFESLFAEEEQRPRNKPEPLSSSQASQVYRFKAYFWHRKGIWRRIEIQAGQTLADFDDILRHAFSHDTSDHLSGFWRLVRRGDSRRFREVDVGTINPFEGGGAGEVRIADLGMEPGEALKYVYDFGDWVEHRVELEATGDPEQGVEYPRIVSQNKPRYRYCAECKGEGKKTVAEWICITCSEWEQEEFPLCEDCMYEHDEDHYIDEMLY